MRARILVAALAVAMLAGGAATAESLFSAGYFLIASAAETSRCLTVDPSRPTANGANVLVSSIWYDGYEDYHLWYVQEVVDGEYIIASKASGMGLALKWDQNTTEGATLIQRTVENAARMRWGFAMVDATSGMMRIERVASDVKGFSVHFENSENEPWTWDAVQTRDFGTLSTYWFLVLVEPISY